MADINNLTDASKRELERTSPKLTLRSGEQVTCGILGWVEAMPLLPKLKGAIKAGVRLWKNLDEARKLEDRAFAAYVPAGFVNPANGAELGAMDAEQTKVLLEQVKAERKETDEEQNNAIDALIDQIDVAPEVLLELAMKSTGKDATFFNDPEVVSWSEVIKIAYTAFKVNFIENEDLRDFFGGELPFFNRGQREQVAD